MYLVLGNLFARFNLQPFETTEKDMDWVDHGITRVVGDVRVVATKRASNNIRVCS